jgi:hypothetical protein
MTLAAIISAIGVGAWLIANVLAALWLDHNRNRRTGR